jgi:HPt (histidine-containing phosphotransfer) domain-containing protein
MNTDSCNNADPIIRSLTPDSDQSCAPSETATPVAPNILKRPVDRELVTLFLVEGPQLIQMLCEAVADHDRATIILVMYRLKGSSTYLGAAALLAVCEKIADQAHQDRLADLDADVKALLIEFERVHRALKEILETGSSDRGD